MRVITHNMLKCNVRGVENGYPLIIEATQTDVIPCEYNKGAFPSSGYLPLRCPSSPPLPLASRNL
jgi:hypothetical protein